jgi:ABC-type nitrate/sulfonate/bicarbonate transport system permease component
MIGMSIGTPERTDAKGAAGGSGGDADRFSALAGGPRAFLRRHLSWPLTILNLTVFVVIWELFARAEIVNPLFLPTPSGVAAELAEAFADGVLVPAVIESLRNFTIGMVLGCIAGIPVGLVMGSSRLANTVLGPYVMGIASLPKVALVPLLILFLGFTNAATVTMVFFSAFFPIVISVMAGPKTVDTSLLRAGRVFGANKLEMYTRVILPFTVPFIISGINQGLTRGLIGLVVAEMFGGNRGLGYVIIRAGETFNSGLLYGVLLCLVAISLAFIHGVRWIETRIAPWRQTPASI